MAVGVEFILALVLTSAIFLWRYGETRQLVKKVGPARLFLPELLVV